MMRADGRVALLDFGVAKVTSDGIDAFAPTTTGAGVIVGTPAYLAPEQARGEPIGPATDQFALAVTAYELMTQELPWPTTTSMMLVAAIISDAPKPIPGFDPALNDVFSRALAKKPADSISERARLRPRARRGARRGATVAATLAHPPSHVEPSAPARVVDARERQDAPRDRTRQGRAAQARASSAPDRARAPRRRGRRRDRDARPQTARAERARRKRDARDRGHSAFRNDERRSADEIQRSAAPTLARSRQRADVRATRRRDHARSGVRLGVSAARVRFVSHRGRPRRRRAQGLSRRARTQRPALAARRGALERDRAVVRRSAGLERVGQTPRSDARAPARRRGSMGGARVLALQGQRRRRCACGVRARGSRRRERVHVVLDARAHSRITRRHRRRAENVCIMHRTCPDDRRVPRLDRHDVSPRWRLRRRRSRRTRERDARSRAAARLRSTSGVRGIARRTSRCDRGAALAKATADAPSPSRRGEGERRLRARDARRRLHDRARRARHDRTQRGRHEDGGDLRGGSSRTPAFSSEMGEPARAASVALSFIDRMSAHTMPEQPWQDPTGRLLAVANVAGRISNADYVTRRDAWVASWRTRLGDDGCEKRRRERVVRRVRRLRGAHRGALERSLRRAPELRHVRREEPRRDGAPNSIPKWARCTSRQASSTKPRRASMPPRAGASSSLTCAPSTHSAKCSPNGTTCTAHAKRSQPSRLDGDTRFHAA